MPTKQDELSPYTLRLKPRTSMAFQKLRGGRTIREVGEEAIEEWIQRHGDPAARGISSDTARELQESLRENLVSAVTEHLRSKPEWAEAAIKAASLLDPIVSIYIQRVHHFHSEKKALSRNFVPWLIRRILHYALQPQPRDVYLVVESGTTLKATFDELGPELQKAADLAKVKPGQVQIVTNNFPGAEEYEAYASRARFGDKLLRDIVPCHLVPGRALREYSAIVGDRAEEYLKSCCPKTQRVGDAVYLGLVVGNWVMLEGGPAQPVPLARGEGHKSFKEVVLDTCDEVFLLTPLGKIIQSNPEKSPEASLTDFNHDFFEAAAEPNEKGEYERVMVPREHVTRKSIKLVSTWRDNRNSIVKTHSVSVNASLFVSPREDYDFFADKPIDEIPHFLYRHDAHVDSSFDEQLSAELPHKRTRAVDFRTKYYKIKDN